MMVVRGGGAGRLKRPKVPSGARSLIQLADITYVGYHTLPDISGNGSVYAAGWTPRVVSSELRFITLGFVTAQGHRPAEVVLTGDPATGGSATQVRQWAVAGSCPGLSNYFGGDAISDGNRCGIYWEEGVGLWATISPDYPDDLGISSVNSITLRQLDDALTYSGFRGLFGVTGIGQRAHYGGIRRIPTSLQSGLGGVYLSGAGGYTSRVAQGAIPSQGPFFVAIPDPLSGTDQTNYFSTTGTISAGSAFVVADCRGGITGADWSPNYSTRTLDRGVRKTLDYCDWYGADNRANPATRPTYPTDYNSNPDWFHSTDGFNTSAYPNDPDGYGRWAWGDTHNGAWDFVDNAAGTRQKHAVITFASVGKGRMGYMSSQLINDEFAVEMHLYDPADFALVKAGSLAAYKVRPYATQDVTSWFPEIGAVALDTPFYTNGVTAAAFVSANNRLYAKGNTRVVVLDIAA